MTSHHIPPLPASPFSGPTRLAGIGNTSQEINNCSGPMLARITGSLGATCPQSMAIFGYGSGFTRILVNAVGPYKGTVLLDEMISRLEVRTKNDWSIKLLPLSAARVLHALNLVRGNGDEVVRSAEVKPITAFIRGNEVSQRFSIITHQGSLSQLLVNTTAPYHESVIFSETTELVEIRAVGPWAMLLI